METINASQYSRLYELFLPPRQISYKWIFTVYCRSEEVFKHLRTHITVYIVEANRERGDNEGETRKFPSTGMKKRPDDYFL